MHLYFSTSPTGFFCDMVSPSVLCFPLLILVLLRRLLLYVFLAFLLLHFICLFIPVRFKLLVLSSYFWSRPPFSLSCPICCIWSSPNSCHSSFPFFVFFSSYRPSPIFSCLFPTSILFSYSSLFSLITCLFSTCFLFIILLFLLSFLNCMWSPILSFRVHVNGLRAPSPWSNDLFLWLRWWMLCCLLSALSNSEIKVLV